MSWIFLLIYFIIVWQNKGLKRRKRNRILINVVENQSTVNSTVKCDKITYTSDQLRDIYHALQLENRRMVPDYGTIRRVKEYKINRRRIRLTKREKLTQRSLNLNNIYQLPLDPELSIMPISSLCLATVNIRSIKNKSEILFELLHRDQVNIIVITESWLKNNDSDKIWLKSQEFAKDGWSYDSIPRKGKRRGGGILLLARKPTKFSRIKVISNDLYEGAIWRVNVGKREFTLFGIYHPPDPNRDMIFTDQLMDELSDLLLRHRNVIVLGDLNIHYNDLTDPSAIYLSDAMKSLNMDQYVKSATHRLGNTLDLVFISNNSQLKIIQTAVTDMLSDHRLVLCQLNVNRLPTHCKVTEIRKIDQETITNIKEAFNEITILDSCNVETAFEQFQQESKRLMDIYCPTKTVKTHIRQRVPWFNSFIKTQRKVVRSAERRWLRYQEEHHWTAYKTERQRYQKLIQFSKRQIYSNQILKAKGDTKKLYQIMYKLNGDQQESKWPPGETDEQLANSFAEFFLK